MNGAVEHFILVTMLSSVLGLRAKTPQNITGLLHFTGSKLYPMDTWENFATAGIGATLLEPDDLTLQSSTEFSINVAGGTQYKVSDSLLIRFEARWLPLISSTDVAGICGRSCVIAFDSSIYNQFQLSAGFSLRF